MLLLCNLGFVSQQALATRAPARAGASPETLAPLEREVRARLQEIDMLMRAPH